MNALKMIRLCGQHQQGDAPSPYTLGIREYTHVVHCGTELFFISEWGGCMPWLSVKEELWDQPSTQEALDYYADVS